MIAEKITIYCTPYAFASYDLLSPCMSTCKTLRFHHAFTDENGAMLMPFYRALPRCQFINRGLLGPLTPNSGLIDRERLAESRQSAMRVSW